MQHKIDLSKFVILITYGWLGVSLLTSMDMADYEGEGFVYIAIAFLCLSSPVWLIHLYRWLFSVPSINLIVAGIYTALSAIAAIAFYDNEDRYAIVLAVPIVHIILTYLMRPRSISRNKNFISRLINPICRLYSHRQNDANSEQINISYFNKINARRHCLTGAIGGALFAIMFIIGLVVLFNVSQILHENRKAVSQYSGAQRSDLEKVDQKEDDVWARMEAEMFGSDAAEPNDDVTKIKLNATQNIEPDRAAKQLDMPEKTAPTTGTVRSKETDIWKRLWTEEYDAQRMKEMSPGLAKLMENRAYAHPDSLSEIGATNAIEERKDALNKRIVFSAIGFLAVIFMSWRVLITKGYISAPLLLAYFIYEAGTNVYIGLASPFWVVLYGLIALLIFDGIRGTWYFRTERNIAPSTCDTRQSIQNPQLFRMLSDIRNNKKRYLARLFLQLPLLLTIITGCAVMLREIGLISKMEADHIILTAFIYLVLSLFSKPLGFTKKAVSFLSALITYYISYQSFAYVFIINEDLGKTIYNIFTKTMVHVDIAAMLIGLGVQLVLHHIFTRKSAHKAGQ